MEVSENPFGVLSTTHDGKHLSDDPNSKPIEHENSMRDDIDSKDSDDRLDEKESKKKQSTGRKMTPRVIFRGNGITAKMVHTAINITYKCRVSGIKGFTNKVIVWSEDAETLDNISWDPDLFDGIRVWTHTRNDQTPPTIGFVAAVSARFDRMTVCNATGAASALRVANGYKLYFSSPAELYVACLQGMHIDNVFRNVNIWVNSRRCLECGMKGHFAKNCTNTNQCNLCNSSNHGFKTCKNKIETIRTERDELANEQWELLRKWCEERHPDLEIRPETDNSISIPWIQVENKRSKVRNKKRYSMPRTRAQSNGSTYADITSRYSRTFARKSSSPEMPDYEPTTNNESEEKEEHLSTISLSEKVMTAIRSGEYDIQRGLDFLKRAKKIHEKKCQQELEMMETMIQETIVLAQGLEYLKNGTTDISNEDTKLNPRKRNYRKRNKSDNEQLPVDDVEVKTTTSDKSSSQQEQERQDAEGEIQDIDMEQRQYMYVPNDGKNKSALIPMMTEYMPMRIEQYFNPRLIVHLHSQGYTPEQMWLLLTDFKKGNMIDQNLSHLTERFHPDVQVFLADIHMTSTDVWNYMKTSFELVADQNKPQWTNYLETVLEAPRTQDWERGEQ